jgi:hypothetical protein
VYQEILQRFKSGRLQQGPFQAAPPQNLPLQRLHVGHKHVLDSVHWLYRSAHAGNELVIGGAVFSRKNMGLTEQPPPRCQGRSHGFGLRSDFAF